MKPTNPKLPKPVRTGRSDSKPTPTLVIRTERRSWITIAISAFGAVLLRYLKTVRERTHH